MESVHGFTNSLSSINELEYLDFDSFSQNSTQTTESSYQTDSTMLPESLTSSFIGGNSHYSEITEQDSFSAFSSSILSNESFDEPSMAADRTIIEFTGVLGASKFDESSQKTTALAEDCENLSETSKLTQDEFPEVSQLRNLFELFDTCQLTEEQKDSLYDKLIESLHEDRRKLCKMEENYERRVKFIKEFETARQAADVADLDGAMSIKRMERSTPAIVNPVPKNGTTQGKKASLTPKKAGSVQKMAGSNFGKADETPKKENRNARKAGSATKKATSKKEKVDRIPKKTNLKRKRTASTPSNATLIAEEASPAPKKPNPIATEAGSLEVNPNVKGVVRVSNIEDSVRSEGPTNSISKPPLACIFIPGPNAADGDIEVSILPKISGGLSVKTRIGSNEKETDNSALLNCVVPLIVSVLEEISRDIVPGNVFSELVAKYFPDGF